MTDKENPSYQRPLEARQALFTLMGVIALLLGILSTGWMVLMVKEWALPWKSLAILAPPKPGASPNGQQATLPPAQAIKTQH